MSDPIDVVLACCLAEHRVNDSGELDPQGLSNRAIAEHFLSEIQRIGGDRLRVHLVKDPIDASISDSVKAAIDSADAMICIFPKRVKCPYTDWTTSQYVISESGYAECRFRHETERRLFGFVEHGVNRNNLGLAFHSNRTLPTFYRGRLSDVVLAEKLQEVVAKILRYGDAIRHSPQGLLLFKRVHVFRSGFVKIDVVHRFSIRKRTTRFVMPHSLWRVRNVLPDFEKMLEAEPGLNREFFRCVPSQCGRHDVRDVRPLVNGISKASHGKEVGFSVEIRNVDLAPGDVVEYRFTYSYGDAFCVPDKLKTGECNSVGLRTGGRGPIRLVKLQLEFERNWHQVELLPTLEQSRDEQGPRLHTTPHTGFPSAYEPQAFWHGVDDWSEGGTMDRAPQYDAADLEAYCWTQENFIGTAKACWVPMTNYHQSSRSPRSDQRNKDRDIDDTGSGI